MQDKQLLFSVTRKDLIRQTFRSGGKGGQNQNKVESGVRFIHEPSGARGEARDSRDQHRNEVNAFLRLVESKEFKNWHRAEAYRRMGQRVPETINEIKARIDRELDDAITAGLVVFEVSGDGTTWTLTDPSLANGPSVSEAATRLTQ